jgi:6-pyruvoyltetrahydropterin/6-carboxytetrahydropterin synthase
MYELTLETVFSAAHAIVVGGVRERVHGHDWRVTACVEGEELDAEGLLVDFHAVERVLHGITSRLHNTHLNEASPFDRVNPTAEQVAAHIARELGSGLEREVGGSRGVRVAWVRVTEAPGCAATYRCP